jgi:hypothetical protein
MFDVPHLVLARHWLAIFTAQTRMKKLQAEYLQNRRSDVRELWLSEFKTILEHSEVLLHVGEMDEEAFYKILLSGDVLVEWHPLARPLVAGFGLKGAPDSVFC